MRVWVGAPRRARRWVGRGVSIPAGRVRRGRRCGRPRDSLAGTRAVRSWPPGERLPHAARLRARIATFDISDAARDNTTTSNLLTWNCFSDTLEPLNTEHFSEDYCKIF